MDSDSRNNNKEYSFTSNLPSSNNENVDLVVRTSSIDFSSAGSTYSYYFAVLKLPSINVKYSNMELEFMVVDTENDYALDYVHTHTKKLKYTSWKIFSHANLQRS